MMVFGTKFAIKINLLIVLFILLVLAPACVSEPTDNVPSAPVSSPTQVVLSEVVPFSFIPDLDTPVFSHGGAEDWFAGAVEPGAVLYDNDKYHLFFNGFDGWPAKSAVGYAISSDGISWQLQSEVPFLDSNEEVFSGFTFFVSSVVQLTEGRYGMYLYTLTEGRDGAPGDILMAVADRLSGPWELKAEPVLTAGKDGAWDNSRVTQPHVLQVDEGFWMYFSGYENDRLQGGRWIGLAKSIDGLTWEKQAEPVFYFSDNARDWDSFRVFQPRVLATESGYLMLYKSNVSVGRNEGVGLAFSEDGIAWSRYKGNPIINERTYDIEWRRNGIAEVLIVDGELILFLEILEREGGAYHHGNADYHSNIFRFTGSLPLEELLP